MGGRAALGVDVDRDVLGGNIRKVGVHHRHVDEDGAGDGVHDGQHVERPVREVSHAVVFAGDDNDVVFGFRSRLIRVVVLAVVARLVDHLLSAGVGHHNERDLVFAGGVGVCSHLAQHLVDDEGPGRQADDGDLLAADHIAVGILGEAGKCRVDLGVEIRFTDVDRGTEREIAASGVRARLGGPLDADALLVLQRTAEQR